MGNSYRKVSRNRLRQGISDLFTRDPRITNLKYVDVAEQPIIKCEDPTHETCECKKANDIKLVRSRRPLTFARRLEVAEQIVNKVRAEEAEKKSGRTASAVQGEAITDIKA